MDVFVVRNGRRRFVHLTVIVFLAVALPPFTTDSTCIGADNLERPAGTVQSNDTILCVIHISVDGLRPDAVTNLGPQHLPNFYRLRVEGTFTDNARTDYDFTVTLPNHVCMVTSRGVNSPDGHNVNFNSDNGSTIEAAHGSYVAGVFDVVHDHGFSTAMYASKSKFAFIDRSYNGDNGAPDVVGEDNGRDKIDAYVYYSNTATLTNTYIADMASAPYTYSFVHFTDPDSEGHSSGWMSVPYHNVVIAVDGFIGQIFDLVDDDPALAGKTAIIVTADHGGSGTGHGANTVSEHYTIPFYVWGPGIPAGVDLYSLNEPGREDPGTLRPDYQAQPQPIRDGDAANLALDLLGLGAVPGSAINDAHDLEVTLPGGSDDLPSVSITSPADGAIFDALDTITVEAVASTGTGSVMKVEFFSNWNKLGEDDTSPYRLTWERVPAGHYTLTARAVRDDDIASTANVDVDITTQTSVNGEGFEHEFAHYIYPNPFGGSARVEFFVPRRERVEMAVYDILGRKVKTIFDCWRSRGRHSAHLTSKELSPGLYVYRLRMGDDIQTGKLMVLR